MWLWIGAVGVVVAGWLYLRWLTSRSGMRTSLGARSAQVGALMTRTAARKATLKMRAMVSSRRRREAMRTAYHVKTAKEAAALMGQMKGVFMKLGQIVSFASEHLPEEARAALAPLQKDAPPMAFPLVRAVIESELGSPLGERFAFVDDEPLAAASIGQVHRARLKDGTDVVLKVQYPGVDAAIRSDLRTTQGLARLIQAVHKNADGLAIVAELKERLSDELDYRQELRNQALFGRIWQGHPLIRIPAVYPEHSARRVLCQEHCQGLDFYDFLEIATDAEKQLATRVLNDFVFDSMHLHGVFNGDPHPGNYLFAPDGGITFLDFGCVKRFEGDFLANVRALNRAIIHHDHADFERLIKVLQIVLEGRPYDADFVWEFFQYHAAPFKDDAVFAFDDAYLARAARVMRPANLRKLNLPPDLLFFNRITFGLNAIFGKLGAKANFHRMYRRYMYPDEQVPPSLALAGASLPPRFLTSTPAPRA